MNPFLRGLVRPVDLHLAVEPVVEQEVVRHANAVRLHRVALAVVVVPDVAYWKKEINSEFIHDLDLILHLRCMRSPRSDQKVNKP